MLDLHARKLGAQGEEANLDLGPKRTRVEVEHRGFARHGAGAELLRGGMASSDGWPYILRQYAEAASPTARAVLSA